MVAGRGGKKATGGNDLKAPSRLTKGPAKRGHIVTATLLTQSWFLNVDSFCAHL